MVHRQATEGFKDIADVKEIRKNIDKPRNSMLSGAGSQYKSPRLLMSSESKDAAQLSSQTLKDGKKSVTNKSKVPVQGSLLFASPREENESLMA